MANIKADITRFPVQGGECAGYLARPAVGTNLPGVVVVQEWWGLNENIKDITGRLAAEGFQALAPDLYRGTVTDNGAKAAALMQEFDVAGAVHDILGAVHHLRNLGAPQVGIVGFCLGGKLAIQAAIDGGDAISAVVPYYGFNPDPISEAAKIAAPVLAIYGEADEMVPPAAARAFEDTLKGVGKTVEMHMYPDAGHAFFNDRRPDAFVPNAANDAWKHTVRFLREHLA
jgi:carboxymethylenebutenolidase